MSIFTDPPITWTADTVCDEAKLNDEVRDKLTDIDNAFIAITPTTYTPGPGETATLDLSKGKMHIITMPAGNITIAVSNATLRQKFLVIINQDSIGSRTTAWFGTIKWQYGYVPVNSEANKIDTYGFINIGSGQYLGFIVGQNA